MSFFFPKPHQIESLTLHRGQGFFQSPVLLEAAPPLQQKYSIHYLSTQFVVRLRTYILANFPNKT